MPSNWKPSTTCSPPARAAAPGAGARRPPARRSAAAGSQLHRAPTRSPAAHPLSQARYLKAELKYVTLVTPDAEYLLDEPLIALEQRLGDAAVRIHRNCLVMRHALRELFRTPADGEEQWQVRLADIEQALPVSRRQLAGIKQCLNQQD